MQSLSVKVRMMNSSCYYPQHHGDMESSIAARRRSVGNSRLPSWEIDRYIGYDIYLSIDPSTHRTCGCGCGIDIDQPNKRCGCCFHPYGQRPRLRGAGPGSPALDRATMAFPHVCCMFPRGHHHGPIQKNNFWGFPPILDTTTYFRAVSGWKKEHFGSVFDLRLPGARCGSNLW